MTTIQKKIKVEVIGIYPEKHLKGVWGTYHIFIPELKMDMRGGQILKTMNGFIVYVPQAKGTDEETGKAIQFPVLSFTDRQYELALRKSIVEAVKKELN